MAPKPGGRFASVKTDPRFRRAKASKSKVQLDDRFKAVLDEGGVFAADNKRDKAKTDKYGRAVASTHDRDQLRKFYSIGDEDGKAESKAAADDKPAFVDYARGEGLLSSSDEESSEDEAGAAAEDDDDEEDGQFIELGGSKRRRRADDGEVEVNLDEGETDPSALALLEQQAAAYSEANPQEQTTETHTKRLAVVNLDWDHLHSIDLFKVFSSVLELGGGGRGKVERVQIFPSEFGRERMEREEREGPPREVFVTDKDRATTSDDDEESEEDGMEMEEGMSAEEGAEGLSEGASGSEPEYNDEDAEDEDDEDINIEDLMADDKGEEIDMDKLRAYQLERLRYYYAVATFSTVAAASYVYNECDNTEFERTANIMDLRFVPDEMAFEDEARDEADEVPALYKGLDFVTDALRHSSVKLTWDDDAPARVAVTRRKLSRKEIDDQDFSAFLASDSESDNEESRTRLRQLLLGNLDDRDEADAFGNDSDSDEDGGKAGGMEITFTPGLTEKGAAGEDDEDDENITTLEAYKKKMREKRRVKKEEREKRLADGGEASSGDEEATAAKPKKKTGKIAKDAFFAAEDSSGDELDANVVQVKAKGGKKAGGAKSADGDKEAALLDLLTLPSTTTTAAEEAMGIDQTKHFSMNDIIKEEKAAGNKKRRRAPHGKKAGADREKEVELGDKNFEIDVKDERFSKKLVDDHRFAIDPSNPHFKKTKAMGKLLEERSKAREKQSGPQERTPASAAPAKANSNGRDRELDSLVASAKRKAGSSSGGGDKAEGKKRRRK